MSNIYPIHDRLLQREAKEQLLGQRAKVLWFTGLSGAGKSTIAQHLEAKLYAEGFLVQVLDGDNLRTGLNANLGFSAEDRIENIRRVAEVAKLFLTGGNIVICTFISPTRASRDQARQIIGEADFLELFVNASLDTCEARDVKGLYAKARAGLIPDFTGIHQAYEEPLNPFLEVRSDQLSVEEAVELIFEQVKAHIGQPA